MREEALKERRSSTKTVTTCDNVERPHIVWAPRGKRVVPQKPLALIIITTPNILKCLSFESS
ncbi:hypothetical protein GCM10011389_13370 [Pontibacillus salipaludis]|uniref:Uncharacterized protein n=1 Tax=Pontibacillus salipaludis TaxID=1697394 RepID=A0ABQ1PYY2_9BACI|nr:hypothetical protein GCM10011389_13370 [Pontibacillus salipaludis]